MRKHGWFTAASVGDRRTGFQRVGQRWDVGGGQLMALRSWPTTERIVPRRAVATEWIPGVTPLDLSRGAGLNAGSGATFNSSGWTDEPTDYLEWGWSASQPIDLTDLDLRYDRSASGPSVVDIQLSINGGAFASIFNDPLVDDLGEDVLDIDLTAFTDVTSATFRLFGTSASGATGTFDLEPLTGVSPNAAIVVSGTAVPVPEPSSQALALARGSRTTGRPAASPALTNADGGNCRDAAAGCLCLPPRDRTACSAILFRG